MTLTLAQLADSLALKFTGKDCSFSCISINSRTLKQGDCFIAIKGDNFDAHNYIAQAVEKGACAVITEQFVDMPIAQLQVPDSRIALGHIAALWRTGFSLPVAAITGSCGKTTVKEMTTAIFQYAAGEILATEGNLNNDIGVPLTLMRLNNSHKMAVIEMGANHIGEIARLTNYTKPDIAVITNAAPAHIEGFGSIECVAQAKAEIYKGLKKNGIAIINADDQFAAYWQEYCHTTLQDKQLNIVSFGLDNSADISADYTALEQGFALTLKTAKGEISFILKHYGKHNIYNALAASAIALSAGCTLVQIKAALENFSNIAGRLEQKQGIAGSVIFDDSYNANPGSVKAGINAIQQFKGESVLILADMAELGEQSEELHYQLGIDAAAMGVARCFTLGDKSHAVHRGFVSLKNGSAQHFSDKKALLDAVKDYLYHVENKKIIMLIKGSRSMAMENVVSELLAENSEPEGGQ